MAADAAAPDGAAPDGAAGDAPTADRPAAPGLAADHADLESLSFEELLELLERLTAAMSSTQVGIEEAADLYERAGRVHRAAAERLERVQRRIDALKRSEPPADPD